MLDPKDFKEAFHMLGKQDLETQKASALIIMTSVLYEISVSLKKIEQVYCNPPARVSVDTSEQKKPKTLEKENEE